jgi:hypothetical protein
MAPCGRDPALKPSAPRLNTPRSPKQIQLARWFERHGDGDGFRYLTHSWLIALFFDCPARVGVTCPSAEDKQELSDAIKQGVIYWHAAPFNPNYEVRMAERVHEPTCVFV